MGDPRQYPNRMQPARTTRTRPRPPREPREEQKPAPQPPKIKEELLRELLLPFGLEILDLTVTDEKAIIICRRHAGGIARAVNRGEDKTISVDLDAVTAGGRTLPDHVPGAPFVGPVRAG